MIENRRGRRAKRTRLERILQGMWQPREVTGLSLRPHARWEISIFGIAVYCEYSSQMATGES